MKTKIFSLIILFISVFTSCGDFDEIGQNPNAATDASIQVIYPAVTASFVYGINGESAQFASILMQYLTGILGDQQQVNNYAFIADMSDATWNRFYSDCLMNIKIIKEKATIQEAIHYRGAAKIMEAAILGYSVDLWNDIPYSTALDLQNVKQPTFDQAASVYQIVQTLLDEGIADLNAQSTSSPALNDYIYPATNENNWRTNSRPRWIKLAQAFKARYHNHLSKVDPAGSATAALAAIDAGTFVSNSEEPKPIFGSFSGPWFPFFNTTFGDNNVGVSQRIINLLRNRIAPGDDDPRLPFYVKTRSATPVVGGLYIGTPNGVASKPANAVVVGNYLNSQSASTPILNYSEVKFIEAEAALRLNQDTRAAVAFNSAVTASLQRVTGTVDAEYIALYGSETAATITLEKILTEKHIDLYLQTEAWNDWRRSIPEGAAPTVSGIPTLLASPSNTTSGAFPRRFIYPNRELVNNSTHVPSVTNLSRVFWDE